MPGLEEEAGDFFDKVTHHHPTLMRIIVEASQVLNLMDRIANSVTPVFFIQNVWLVMLTTPGARGSAVNYLARRFPQLDDITGAQAHPACVSKLTISLDISTVVGRDVGLMIRAFAACLEDENLLVRRGALDLLVANLRLNGKVLQQ